MKQPQHSEIAAKVLELRDEIMTWGIDVPFALKRRDPKEPGRKQKEEYEDKLFALFMRYFRKQRKTIKELLERTDPGRKAINDRNIDYYMNYLGDEFWLDPLIVAALAGLLTKAAQHGITLFGASITLQMDYTLTNVRAAEWASKYSYELVKGIDATTTKALQKIFKTFIETPGMTIGDVVTLLPYNEHRSLMIATTEITRTYAEAAQMAGKELAREFPGVQVIKTWWTNNDDRVCPICGPLHGQEVDINEKFIVIVNGIIYEFDGPAAHIGCRCWRSTSTRMVKK